MYNPEDRVFLSRFRWASTRSFTPEACNAARCAPSGGAIGSIAGGIALASLGYTRMRAAR
jgi:hypothetical protein